jgi:hypothetical protein
MVRVVVIVRVRDTINIRVRVSINTSGYIRVTDLPAQGNRVCLCHPRGGDVQRHERGSRQRLWPYGTLIAFSRVMLIALLSQTLMITFSGVMMTALLCQTLMIAFSFAT